LIAPEASLSSSKKIALHKIDSNKKAADKYQRLIMPLWFTPPILFINLMPIKNSAVAFGLFLVIPYIFLLL
jgi:hypothetical protein